LDGRLSRPYGAAAQRLKSLTGSHGRNFCFQEARRRGLSRWRVDGVRPDMEPARRPVDHRRAVARRCARLRLFYKKNLTAATTLPIRHGPTALALWRPMRVGISGRSRDALLPAERRGVSVVSHFWLWPRRLGEAICRILGIRSCGTVLGFGASGFAGL